MVKNGIMGYSDIGNEAALLLQSICENNEKVNLDEFMIMPNHIHAIAITNGGYQTSNKNRFSNPIAGSISMLINHFKGALKKWCIKIGYYFEWQSRFHDHIIRSMEEYYIIKNYIINNPRNWMKDRFFILYKRPKKHVFFNHQH